MQRTSRAAIFDLDGTLADTFPLIVASWNAAMPRSYTAAEVISRFGIPEIDMIRRELHPQSCDDAVARFMRHYEEHHAIVRPFPGITEMLDELHHRGIPMALVSGKGRGTCEITIRALGWSKYFRRIISGHDVQNQKPHPEGALSAAEGAGVSPKDCAFIGDAPADIRTGQNAGMTTIAAAWHPIYLDQLKALNPDHFATTPSELINLFQNP